MSGLGGKVEPVTSTNPAVAFLPGMAQRDSPLWVGADTFPASEGKSVVCFEVYSQEISLIQPRIAMIIITSTNTFR